jgi:hypothetical protein
MAFAQVYAELELGYSSADINLGSPYNGVVDDRASVVGADFGVNLGSRWAVELGVNKYNSFDGRATPCAPGASCLNEVVPTGSNDINSYSLALVPHFDLKNIVLFAELGYYSADIDTDIGIADDDFTEDGVMIGGGARWYFSEPWSVSLEATRMDENIYQMTVGIGWGLRLGKDDDRSDRRDDRRSDRRRGRN